MPTFTLNDLAARVKERAAASPETSYTRKLLDRGVAQCAKKLGEEAVETALVIPRSGYRFSEKIMRQES